ncbi:MAG: hypothetical protein GYA36_21785 [Veillonellaceae bacterium]|nr:hypothetical protein [Veillonellaceae bacterium]
MTVRDTMAELIADLRGLTDANVGDYTVGGVTFWSDQQLQDVLDGRCTAVRFIQMTPAPDYANGVFTYTDYILPAENMEGGTALIIQDNTGGTVGGWTFDRNRGVVTFATDQAGASRFVTGRSYNVNLAAADVWRKKASHYAAAYDVSTDNHSLKRSQLIQHCQAMAREFEARGGPASVTMERGDC